jgi:hypothetical protein
MEDLKEVIQIDSGYEIPILLVIFNRPDLTLKIINRLREIRPRKIFIAADGPRNQFEVELIEKTRKTIQYIDWECKIETNFQLSNLGCGRAVSTAISWFFEHNEFGVILEDDCLPDPSFFKFCSALLIKYLFDSEIMMIGGNNFLNNSLHINSTYFFSQYPHIWGWATWRRAWALYEFEIQDLDIFGNVILPKAYKTNRQRRYLFNHLKLVRDGEIDTWDYQWTYAILKNKGLSITPSSNLVINLGFTNQATHYFLRDSIKERNTISSFNGKFISPPKKINFEADFKTFQNIYSHGFFRLIRLIRENGIKTITHYFFKRLK